MSTDQLSVSNRRRRINRTPEFKTKIVAACLHVGVSVTAIAREYGLNLPSNHLLASATLDRLRHNAYCLLLDGQSYRTPKISSKIAV